MKELKLQVGALLPGEQLAAAIVNLATEMVRKMPQEVAEQYWKFALEDYARWREFWSKLLPKTE